VICVGPRPARPIPPEAFWLRRVRGGDLFCSGRHGQLAAAPCATAGDVLLHVGAGLSRFLKTPLSPPFNAQWSDSSKMNGIEPSCHSRESGNLEPLRLRLSLDARFRGHDKTRRFSNRMKRTTRRIVSVELVEAARLLEVGVGGREQGKFPAEQGDSREFGLFCGRKVLGFQGLAAKFPPRASGEFFAPEQGICRELFARSRDSLR
jgi:hypothetical protein